MGTQLILAKKEHSPLPIFGSCLLCPNGWMDQDATWCTGRPRPKRHCVSWELGNPASSPRTPIFGPCLLWPNVCMDQDATWYDGGPTQHCVRCGPSSTPKGHSSPQILAHVCCGQTAGWIKMPLCTKVGLRSLTLKGHFGPCLLWTSGRPSQLLRSTCSKSCIPCKIARISWLHRRIGKCTWPVISTAV